MGITKVPNAIVVGAGKAGSTSLHNYLNAHPQVFGSEQKELMYFTRFLDKGAAWYQSHFPLQDGVEVYFESTPQYSFRDEFPGVPQRIFDYNPDMKILYIVREPLSRIVSHFNHWARTQSERYSDLETSLKKPGHRKFFVDRTRYHYQLMAYLDVFPSDQVRVVFLEELRGQFERALNEVFEFLGVSPVADTIPYKVFNPGSRHKDVSRQWQVSDISEERRVELCQTLSSDVQQLLSHCGKPADFWGDAYR